MRVLVIQKFDHDKRAKIAVKAQNNGEPKNLRARAYIESNTALFQMHPYVQLLLEYCLFDAINSVP